MDMADTPNGGTNMKWSADAKVGGRIASVGQRLLSGQAEKIVKGLFECLRTKLEAAYLFFLNLERAIYQIPGTLAHDFRLLEVFQVRYSVEYRIPCFCLGLLKLTA